MWAHLVTLVAGSPAPRDAAAFLAHLEMVSPLELQRRLIGYYVPWFRALIPIAVMDAALRGERDAARRLLSGSFPEDAAWQVALRSRLADGATRTKRQLLELVADWDQQVFEPLLLGRMRQLRAASRERQRSVVAAAGPEALASAFTGWRYIAEPGISRILIVPSLVIGRTVHAFEHGQTQVLCCGVDARRHALPAAPAGLVSVARALSEPNRVRIVRALAASDLTAQELSDRVGIGLTTVLHHLDTLRSAQLVGAGGRRQRYQLRPRGLSGYANQIRSLAGR